jgi:hypothetical protein
MKKTFNILYLLLAVFSMTLVSCEDKIDPLVEELQFERVFTPLNLKAFIRNKTNVELQWDLRSDAEYYIVEFSEDSLVFGSIIATENVQREEVPFTYALEGETRYSARVKGVQENGAEDSNWAEVTFMTDPENIYLPIQDGDIDALEATVRWTPGAEVTHLLISPGDVTRTITDEEKAAGVAIITGLSAETAYSVTLYRNTKKRGTVTFETLVDVGDAVAINPGDDLGAILDAAEEGASFVVFQGVYDLGSYTLTKSVKLSGYKSNEKPTINGQFVCGSTVASIELKGIIFKGNAGESTLGQFFNTATGCNITTLTLDDCEINNYGNNLIYNNSSGIYGTINISNCIISEIQGSGGDGIDFRSGTINALNVENSTFANGFRTFMRMQVACAVSFKSCTFYKVSAIDNSNNNGLFRMNSSAGGSFEVRNCLFVETGVESPTATQAGNFCRQSSYMVDLPTYANNNISNCHNLLVGLYTSASQISATELDPGFTDAENGDFTVTNQTVIDNLIGDPRWLP